MIDDWLTVSCPKCLAERGESCIAWPSGYPRIEPHAARLKLVRRQKARRDS